MEMCAKLPEPKICANLRALWICLRKPTESRRKRRRGGTAGKCLWRVWSWSASILLANVISLVCLGQINTRWSNRKNVPRVKVKIQDLLVLIHTNRTFLFWAAGTAGFIRESFGCLGAFKIPQEWGSSHKLWILRGREKVTASKPKAAYVAFWDKTLCGFKTLSHNEEAMLMKWNVGERCLFISKWIREIKTNRKPLSVFPLMADFSVLFFKFYDSQPNSRLKHFLPWKPRRSVTQHLIWRLWSPPPKKTPHQSSLKCRGWSFFPPLALRSVSLKFHSKTLIKLRHFSITAKWVFNNSSLLMSLP